MNRTSPKLGGRLNAFQRMMYQWSDLHPYNAVHTYRLAGALCRESLAAAIRQVNQQNGLGIATVFSGDTWYRWEADSDPEVAVIPVGGDPELALAAHIAGELNRPFGRPQCRPFRYFLMDAGRGEHYLTVTYDHWVADSVAARLILRHVLGRYCRLSIPENEQPIELYPRTYRHTFPDRFRGSAVALAAARTFRQWWSNRSAAQVPYASTAQMAVDFQRYRAAPGTVGRLRQFARSQQISVNDVLMAALARATAACLPRRAMKKGGKLALGCIVDTRGDTRDDLARALGTFLSYYRVPLDCADGADLSEVGQRIAAATRPIKARHSYLDSLVAMKLMSSLWPHLRQQRKRSMMHKGLLLSAGISNLLVRDAWMERQGAGRVLEFARACPTGPMLPLVIGPTTFGGEMNIGVTYRTTGYSQRKVDELIGLFLQEIEHPASATRATVVALQPQSRRKAS